MTRIWKYSRNFMEHSPVRKKILCLTGRCSRDFWFSTKPNPKDRRFKNGVDRRTRSSERVEYWSNICYDSVLELVSQLCYFKFKTFSHFSDNYSVADVLKISNYEENLWMFMTISQDLVFSTYYFETDNLWWRFITKYASQE